jgi:hypothetical protein
METRSLARYIHVDISIMAETGADEKGQGGRVAMMGWLTGANCAQRR